MVIGRIVAGVAAGLAALVFLLTAWMALSSRFGPAERDMHGYGLIFGTVLAVLAAFALAVILPLALPRRHWGRAYAVALASFAVVLVALIVSLITA